MNIVFLKNIFQKIVFRNTVFRVLLSAGVFFFGFPLFSLEAQQKTPEGFVLIEGGTFMMGSPDSEADREDHEVRHRVTLRSFYMSRYEVTQKEWAAVMGTTLRQQRDRVNPDWSLFGEDDEYPMYYVSWFDAVEYCNKRSSLEGLTPVYTIQAESVWWNPRADGYRLPTESEWEYACRAETTGPFNTGAALTANQANYDGAQPYTGVGKGVYRETVTPVGSFAPNQWGLYDMHGNVWEWCWDRYGDYPQRLQTDPSGPSWGSDRVYRGGGWFSHPRYLRSASRSRDDPSSRYSNLGFRLARSIP